jgi:hypothetical protein
VLLRGLGAGLGDDFERDNFDFVQAAVAATPAPALVRAPPSWLATPFAAAAPPAPVVAAPLPATPWAAVATAVGRAISPVFTPAPPAPAPASSTPGIASRIGSGGAIAPAQLPLDAVSTDPDVATLQAQVDATNRKRWTMLAIAGAAGVGMVLLLRR